MSTATLEGEKKEANQSSGYEKGVTYVKMLLA